MFAQHFLIGFTDSCQLGSKVSSDRGQTFLITHFNRVAVPAMPAGALFSALSVGLAVIVKLDSIRNFPRYEIV